MVCLLKKCSGMAFIDEIVTWHMQIITRDLSELLTGGSVGMNASHRFTVIFHVLSFNVRK